MTALKREVRDDKWSKHTDVYYLAKWQFVSYPGLCLSLFLFAVYSLQFLTDQGDVWHIDQIWHFQAMVLFWRKCWVWYGNKAGYLWFWLSRDLFRRVLTQSSLATLLVIFANSIYPDEMALLVYFVKHPFCDEWNGPNSKMEESILKSQGWMS